MKQEDIELIVGPATIVLLGSLSICALCLWAIIATIK